MCVSWWWWHVELGGAHKCLKPLTNLKHFCLDSGWWFAWISVNVIIVSGLRYQSANTFRECSYAEKLRLRNLLRLCDLRLSGLWHLRLWGLWRLRELAITECLPLLIPLPRKLLPLPTEPILRHASSVWKWCTPAKTSSLSGAPTLSTSFACRNGVIRPTNVMMSVHSDVNWIKKLVGVTWRFGIELSTDDSLSLALSIIGHS